MDEILPEIVKTVKSENGDLMFEDEASFRVSGTISRGWMRKGHKEGKEVKSKPTRESAKVFGSVTVSDKPKFHFLFANVLTHLRQFIFSNPLFMRGWAMKNIHCHYASPCRVGGIVTTCSVEWRPCCARWCSWRWWSQFSWRKLSICLLRQFSSVPGPGEGGGLPLP